MGHMLSILLSRFALCAIHILELRWRRSLGRYNYIHLIYTGALYPTQSFFVPAGLIVFIVQQ